MPFAQLIVIKEMTMSIDKLSLRARATHLFAAEERNQDLMALALLQQGDHQTLEASTLDTLVLNSDQNILTVHKQLQHARHYGAQLQAEDKQLAMLTQLIYGDIQNTAVNEAIIDGEIIVTNATLTD
jgi:hypothetical protein